MEPAGTRVAVLQMACVPGEVDHNVEELLRLVDEHGRDADIVVAPELATTGYDLDLLRRHGRDLATTADGDLVRRLREAATGVGTTLVTGFLEREGDDLFDSLLTARPDGPADVYRKTHLYPPEAEPFTAGATLKIVPTRAGTLGPLVCFEHAFPEVATALALAGAEILIIPSAVPYGFEDLLRLRTRARAQDNQIYAVAANMAGHGFCGRSLVAGPRGEVLTEAGETETVLHATLDLAAVAGEREREPALRLRRPELYVDGALWDEA